MEGNLDVREIVQRIKKEILEENMSGRDQYLTTEYYERRMREYAGRRELVIFGAGYYGVSLYKALQREGLSDRVTCFCDNNISKHQSKIEERFILSTETALKQYPDAMVIITPRGFENEILRQLVSLGKRIEDISIFILGLTGLEE